MDVEISRYIKLTATENAFIGLYGRAHCLSSCSSGHIGFIRCWTLLGGTASPSFPASAFSSTADCGGLRGTTAVCCGKHKYVCPLPWSGRTQHGGDPWQSLKKEPSC